MWNPFKREIVIKPQVNVMVNPRLTEMLQEQNRHLKHIDEQMTKFVEMHGPHVVNFDPSSSVK